MLTVGHGGSVSQHVKGETRSLSHVQTEVHRKGSRDGGEAKHHTPCEVILRGVRKSQLVDIVSLVISSLGDERGVLKPFATVDTIDNTDIVGEVSVGVGSLEASSHDGSDDSSEKVSDTLHGKY